VAAIITLLLVGAALLLLETFLPGMIAGVIGVCCLVAGVALAYTNHGPATGNIVLVLVLIGLVLGTMCWMRFLPESRLARRLISHQAIGDLGAERPELLDRTGTALTTLRPSGTASIDGQRVDVVADGAMIERGAPVKVVAVEGARVVVRAVEPKDRTHGNENL
jgi:membrane-bound serine protease (ClpP class)